MRRALEAYRIPILEVQGFEADDVIGTLATKAVAKAGHRVCRVERQRHDAVGHRSGEGAESSQRQPGAGREKVIETLGVPPEKVIDVMALRGDSIDNIPGAPGIGDKGSRRAHSAVWQR